MVEPISSSSFQSSPQDEDARINDIRDTFQRAWQEGRLPRIEDFLAQVSAPKRASLLRALLQIEFAHRPDEERSPARAEYERRFPEYRSVVADLIPT